MFLPMCKICTTFMHLVLLWWLDVFHIQMYLNLFELMPLLHGTLHIDTYRFIYPSIQVSIDESINPPIYWYKCNQYNYFVIDMGFKVKHYVIEIGCKILISMHNSNRNCSFPFDIPSFKFKQRHFRHFKQDCP